MRRTLLSVAGGLLAAGLLAGCGPSAVSYNDGFAVGQSLAAAAGHGELVGHRIVVTCVQQWRVSGPATDDRKVWIKGCVAGVNRLNAVVG
jgi:hypothetical protein